MPGAQDGERLGVLLLDRREQLPAQRLDLLADLRRPARQEPEPDQRQRLVEPADDRADVEPGGGRAGQHRRVDRRVEQRQLPEDALDVEAVADLEEPVGDGVPVAEQLVVARDAEVERGARCCSARPSWASSETPVGRGARSNGMSASTSRIALPNASRSPRRVA